MPPSSSSTRPRALSTRRRSARCSARSTGSSPSSARRGARSSSSPTGSPRSGTPTGSSSSRAAASSRWARTTSSSPGAASTRGSTACTRERNGSSARRGRRRRAPDADADPRLLPVARMIRKLLLAAAVVALGAWLALGIRVRAQRAVRLPQSQGEARGAWHVHTTHSDGRGTLDEVVAAARAAGLQFVVVTDHNVMTPEDQGWRNGVLVVEGTEVSTPFGHVAALGGPRALTVEERDGDPLGAIARLGGAAVIAHPLHPRRPFTGWGRGAWRGMEIVSNDTSWGEVVVGRAWGRAALAAAALPFDGARAVLTLQEGDAERRRFDEELRAARRVDPRRPARVLFCSADAHGYPSYRAAFEAFSMHLPIALSGDAGADVRSVTAALTDGRAVCVIDGVAPASEVRLVRARGRRGFDLHLDAPDLSLARFTLLRDGDVVAQRTPAAGAGAAVIPFDCDGGTCPPGDYRVEGRWDGRPWIFTNPVGIE